MRVQNQGLHRPCRSEFIREAFSGETYPSPVTTVRE
jgi:hypothetical protein